MATVLVLFLAWGIFAIAKPLITSKASDQGAKRVQITYSGMPSTGNPNAPVKLMEFGDFNCPYCKLFHQQIYPQLKKDFIDTGKVQMYFTSLNFLGQNSATTSQAAEAVYKQNPEAFWKYYDVIYENQGQEDKPWATPEFVTSLIKKNIPEVNADQVSQALKNKTYEQAVAEHNKIAESIGVESFPTIYVNGLKVENAFDYNSLKNMIEAELNKK
jgi:protein-disulfide isomerase